MTKATLGEIDGMILGEIKGGPCAAYMLKGVVAARLHADSKGWPFASGIDDEDRVIDRRLQSLRKRGVIRFSRVERRWVLA